MDTLRIHTSRSVKLPQFFGMVVVGEGLVSCAEQRTKLWRDEL
jgi:hypothetical protein